MSDPARLEYVLHIAAGPGRLPWVSLGNVAIAECIGVEVGEVCQIIRSA